MSDQGRNSEQDGPVRSPWRSGGPDQKVIHGQNAFLYVVTVNYHSRHHLIRLLDCLAGTGIVKKFIVVNHSNGEPLEGLTADFPIEIIDQENRGYGAGLNRGLKEVSEEGAFVLLCNPDVVILNPEAIKDIQRYLIRNPEAGVVLPALVNREFQPVASCRKFYNFRTIFCARVPWLQNNRPKFLQDHYYEGQLNGVPVEVDWGPAAAMFVRSSVLGSDPLFDERFFLYFEDVDFCARLWESHSSVVYFPGLICQHNEQRLSSRSPWFLMLHLVSLMKFVLKHRGLPERSDLVRRKRPGLNLPGGSLVPESFRGSRLGDG